MTTRLNAQMRAAIVTAAITHKFAKQKVDLKKRGNAWALKVYKECMGPSNLKLIKRIPEDWIGLTKGMCCEFAGQQVWCEFAGVQRVPLSWSRRYSGGPSLPASHPLNEERLLLQREQEDLDEKQNQVRASIRGILQSHQTVEGLLKTWPECKKFIPAAVAPVAALALPIKSTERDVWVMSEMSRPVGAEEWVGVMNENEELTHQLASANARMAELEREGMAAHDAYNETLHREAAAIARSDAAEQETRRTAKQSAENFAARQRAEAEATALLAEVERLKGLDNVRRAEQLVAHCRKHCPTVAECNDRGCKLAVTTELEAAERKVLESIACCSCWRHGATGIATLQPTECLATAELARRAEAIK